MLDIPHKRFLFEKSIGFAIVSALAILMLVGMIVFKFEPVIIALTALAIMCSWIGFAVLAHRVRKGTFGSRPYERDAFERWMKRNGARRIRGMHLPG